MTLQVTQAAITEILRLYQRRRSETNAEAAIVAPAKAQLDFVPGGCAEQRYQLNFNAESSGSQTVDCDSVVLYISQTAWPHVQELTLDYVEDLMGGSFRFDNPQLSQTCNCGQSFCIPSPE